MITPRKATFLVLLVSLVPSSAWASRSSTPRHPGEFVLAAAGDVACDPDDRDFRGGRGTRDRCRQAATGKLLSELDPDVVAALGDLQYEDGARGKWDRSFHRAWGHMKERIRPVPGNHEYRSRRAKAYFRYFGAAAGTPGDGWYSYDLGAWHVVALNSNCADVKGLCRAGSEQMRWLAADLAANPSRCTLAYWHHPRWSSGKYGSDESVEPFMEMLHRAGAEIVLSGHAHSYERFAPMDSRGRRDADGIRTFVVGTGGKSHAGFKKVLPGSEARDDDTFGALELRLRDGSYEWRMVPEDGGRPIDSGTGTCH